MQELVFLGPERLELREAKAPTILNGKQAVVRPLAATTCDLDRALIMGKAPLPGPFALGHECVGEIVDKGDDVQLAIGDVVAVPWSLHCGECARCQKGLSASCLSVPPKAMYGTSIGGHFGGLFSDLVHVPFADAMLVKVPSALRPEDVASVSDNLTDAWVAVKKPLQAKPGARVLIVGGVGSIGLFAIEMAKAAGASGVDYVDRGEERLAIARELGANVIPRGVELPPEYDVVVDASANPAELSRALKACAPGAFCTSVGIYFMDTPLPLLDMYAQDVTFRIGRCSVAPHMRDVLALIERGVVRPHKVTSVVAPWETRVETLLAKKMKPVLVRST